MANQSVLEKPKSYAVRLGARRVRDGVQVDWGNVGRQRDAAGRRAGQSAREPHIRVRVDGRSQALYDSIRAREGLGGIYT